MVTEGTQGQNGNRSDTIITDSRVCSKQNLNKKFVKWRLIPQFMTEMGIETTIKPPHSVNK